MAHEWGRARVKSPASATPGPERTAAGLTRRGTASSMVVIRSALGVGSPLTTSAYLAPATSGPRRLPPGGFHIPTAAHPSATQTSPPSTRVSSSTPKNRPARSS